MENIITDSMEILNEKNNEINNSITSTVTSELYEDQKNFLNTSLGKTINSAVDIAIKAALPNIIEDEVIKIKDAILENGFKEGIKEAINSGIDIGKSSIGIITGDFENISQVQLAVKKGGIIDSTSNLLDYAIKYASTKGFIPNEVANILKKSKENILESVSNKIENNFANQLKYIEKLEKSCKKWEEAFESKNVDILDKSYKEISKEMDRIIPMENIIKEARKIENIQKLLINNNYNFDISQNEILLAQKL